MAARRLLPDEPGAELRRLISLAWPVVLTSLNWTIMQVTDVVVVGAVGTAETAAFGAGRAIGLVTVVAGLTWLSGILVQAARADGAGDAPARAAVLRQGLALALLLGLVAGALQLAAAEPLLRALGVAPALVAPGGVVVQLFALAMPFQLLTIAAAFFLEGISRPRQATAVYLTVLPANALLTWMLATGAFGLPGWGAAGAAAGTLIASVIGAVAMLVVAWPHAAGARPGGAALLAGVIRLAGFGTIPAAASALEIAGFSILIALSTRIGAEAAHAFQIVFAVHNVTFALAMGLASAAGVRTGNAVGEGRWPAARGRVALAIGLTTAVLGVATLLLVTGGAMIAAVFPATAGVRALAVTMLALWAPFILFDGVQVVLVYALRSLGDQVVAGVNSILAFFVVTGGLGWRLVAAGVGPTALVWASAAGMVAAAALHGARFAIVSGRPPRS